MISLLKRWLIQTHRGALSHKHLVRYFDEFTSASIVENPGTGANCSFVWLNKLSPLIPSRAAKSFVQTTKPLQAISNLLNWGELSGNSLIQI